MKEIWKDIPGFESEYQASTFGRVKSLDRISISNRGQLGYKRKLKGRIIIPNINIHGRQVIRLAKNCEILSTHISRIIALTFIPNPENKPTVNHIDGNHLNNRPENLEWATYAENFYHGVDTGLIKVRGENNYFAKLKNKDVSKIRVLLSNGIKRSEIASLYGVSYGTIYGIDKKLYWSKTV